jgi:hypothetical protein
VYSSCWAGRRRRLADGYEEECEGEGEGEGGECDGTKGQADEEDDDVVAGGHREEEAESGVGEEEGRGEL